MLSENNLKETSLKKTIIQISPKNLLVFNLKSGICLVLKINLELNDLKDLHLHINFLINVIYFCLFKKKTSKNSHLKKIQKLIKSQVN